MRILYGNDASDWNLVTFSHETGAYRNSMLTVGFGIAMSRRGVVAINPSDTFGNFNVSALSQQIEKYIAQRGAQIRGTTSTFTRNQFVFHFGGGQALTGTVTREGIAGFMPLNYGRGFNCFWSCACPDDQGDLILAGGDDGFVYRLGVGTSFDGQPIPARLWLAYANLGSPRNRKRFRKAVIEATADRFANFTMNARYAFGDESIQPFVESGVRNVLPGFAVWDSADWDAFFFDGRPLDPVEIKLEGSGESMSIMFDSNTDLAGRFTLHGSIVHFDTRRLIR